MSLAPSRNSRVEVNVSVRDEEEVAESTNRKRRKTVKRKGRKKQGTKLGAFIASNALSLGRSAMRDRARKMLDMTQGGTWLQRYRHSRIIINPSNLGLHVALLISAICKTLCWLHTHNTVRSRVLPNRTCQMRICHSFAFLRDLLSV